MKTLSRSLAVLSFFSFVPMTVAEEMTSGLAVGKTMLSMPMEKRGGLDDGVKTGDAICYTWRLGARPVVTVFASTTDDALAGLVKKLDALVSEHQDRKLAAVIAFVGSDRDAILAEVDKFQQKHEFKNVVLTVPKDHRHGVRGLNLNPDAAATVLVYRDKKIRANRAAAVGQVGAAFVDGVATDIKNVAMEKPNGTE